MSDTPRTDDAIEYVEVVGNYGMGSEYQIAYVAADFARELEREVVGLRAINLQLQVDLGQRDKDYEDLQALM